MRQKFIVNRQKKNYNLNKGIDIPLAKTKHKKTSWGITVDKNSITWRNIN